MPISASRDTLDGMDHRMDAPRLRPRAIREARRRAVSETGVIAVALLFAIALGTASMVEAAIASPLLP
ncbi:hypothetical protein [Oricola sp.]|uniref:hypothetical protein n=1 Tax=Oricola sp. TaxID=1979950 RepID=UPI0025E6DA75|nr:hypothetical protein [Oricola sp.]MCI5077748.1 hypothetical protein [Oricola sp.]